ncbi:MAG: hypothetical protein N3A58_08055 [Spirochaetes bacterium]|nr:hypothetical protein [Spirochaetota bacterium]
MGDGTYLEKILKNLSENERKILYEKFSRVLYISDDSVLDQVEEDNEKSKNYLIKSYKLTLLDSIIIFINSLFGYYDIEKYILKKEIKKIVKLLNSKNTIIYNLSDDTLNKIFFSGIYNISDFIKKYDEFLKYFYLGFKEKIIKEKILLYFLESLYDETVKKKLENFSDKNIEKMIYEDSNYKKKLFEIKKDILNSLRGKIENNFNNKLNLFFNLINFFNLEINFLVEFSKKFDEKVPLNQIKDQIAFFIKKVLNFPFENENIIQLIKQMVEYYKNIQFDFDIEERDIELFINSILFYIYENKGLNLLKIIYNNPVYEYEFVRYKIDFFKEVTKYIDNYLEKKVKEVEQNLKIKERENIYNKIKELNLKQYNFVNLDENINKFLEEYNLPLINYIEKIGFITSFYFYVWQTFFSIRIDKILREKFYLFEKVHIDSINDSLKIIDKTQFIIESIEEKTRNLKIFITREFKDKSISHDSEKYKYAVSNISLLNEFISDFCNNFIHSIELIDKSLMFNQTDDFVLIFRKELEKYLNILRLF